MRIRHLGLRLRIAVTWAVAFLMVINSAPSRGLACQSCTCEASCMTACQSAYSASCGTPVYSPCEPACGVASSCAYEIVVIHDCGYPYVTACVDVNTYGVEHGADGCASVDDCGGAAMCGGSVVTFEAAAEESATQPAPSASDRPAPTPMPPAEPATRLPSEASPNRTNGGAPPPPPESAVDEVTPPVAPEPTPSATEPAVAPVPAMDEGGIFEDAFGETEAAEPPAPPAESPLDDLFDEPPARDPAEPPTVPEIEDGGMDDLFDEMPAEAPAEEPAMAPDEGGMDDLFDELPADSPDDASAAESGFPELEEAAPPAEEPATEEPAAEEPSDSLGDLEDLFGTSRSPSRQTIGARQFPLRVWTDNTGKFTAAARLIELGDGYVRLHKVNGRRCTVAHRRLSKADFRYVQTLAAELGLPAITRLAGR